MKRLVFIHSDGLHQILTATDRELPVMIQADGGELMEMLPGRLVPFASLVRVTPRAAYYRHEVGQ